MGVISTINKSEWGYKIIKKVNNFIKIDMLKIEKKNI